MIAKNKIKYKFCLCNSLKVEKWLILLYWILILKSMFKKHNIDNIFVLWLNVDNTVDCQQSKKCYETEMNYRSHASVFNYDVAPLPVHRTCCEPHSTEHQMTPLSPAHVASHPPLNREKQII